MTSDQKKKTIVGIIVFVILVLIVAALSGKPKESADTAQSEVSAQQVEETPAVTEDAAPVTSADTTTASEADTTTSAKLSDAGLYEAECMVDGGTTLGRVEVDEDADPAKEKTIGIKNMNTGKVTKIDMSKAVCTFTPLKK